MSTTDDTSQQLSRLLAHARLIESYMVGYIGTNSGCAVEQYINCYPDEFLALVCPEALNLPAAFIANETGHEAFVGIHISEEFAKLLDAHETLETLLSNREGLNAFLVLVEEISHFHNYVISAETDGQLSRFDLELQAEVDKVIIGALALIATFGRPHLNELVHLLFNESIICGTLTDYALASKLAEKFWKKNLHQLGSNILFDSRFRRLLQQASRKSGEEKIMILETIIQAA
jgi:hypothetical protein